MHVLLVADQKLIYALSAHHLMVKRCVDGFSQLEFSTSFECGHVEGSQLNGPFQVSCFDSRYCSQDN
jgi:hypothetical protein